MVGRVLGNRRARKWDYCERFAPNRETSDDGATQCSFTSANNCGMMRAIQQSFLPPKTQVRRRLQGIQGKFTVVQPGGGALMLAGRKRNLFAIVLLAFCGVAAEGAGAQSVQRPGRPSVTPTTQHQPTLDSLALPKRFALRPTGILPPTWRTGQTGEAAADATLGPLGRFSERELETPTREPEPLVIGIQRAISASSKSAGRWQVLADGTRVWTFTVRSEGALGIKVHFSKFALPAGVRMFAYPGYPGTPGDVVFEGERDGVGFLGGEDVQTPIVFGDVITLELEDNRQEQLADEDLFVIRAVSHIFRPLTGATSTPAVCEVDATCHPEWDSTGAGVGRMSFTEGTLTYACTGTLLNNDSGDFSPLFLTANHCINDPVTAQSLQVFWSYRTTSCNGPAPTLNPATSTVGARLLRHVSFDQGSDFSLLELRGPLPEGTTYAGWDTFEKFISGNVTGLHHPLGSWRRISIGDVTGTTTVTDNGLTSPPDYYSVTWSVGTIEPGSSGSGLFDTNHHLIGQLFGGDPVDPCTPTKGYYGRLSDSYPNMVDGNGSNYLVTGLGDDWLAPNTTQATAVTLNPGTYKELVLRSVADDWYHVNVWPQEEADVTFNVDKGGTYAIDVYQDAGTSPTQTIVLTGTTQLLALKGVSVPTDYYLRVYFVAGVRGYYDILVNKFSTVPPTISSLSPSSGPLGGTDFVLTINGTNFSPSSYAFWNGTPLVSTFVNSFQIQSSVPGYLLTGQTASIKVEGGGGFSNTLSFAIVSPPGILDVSPLVPMAPTGLGMNFGSVAVGAEGAQTLTVTNIGLGTVTLSSITLLGDSEFSAGTCKVPFQGTFPTLAPGQSCTLVVTLAPVASTGIGSHHVPSYVYGTLVISATNARSASIALQGIVTSQIANDHLTSPMPITPGVTIEQSFGAATLDTSDSETGCVVDGGGVGSLWYQYTPANSTTATISVSTPGGGAYAYEYVGIKVLQVANGAMTRVGCGHGTQGAAATTLQVVGGGTYLIMGWATTAFAGLTYVSLTENADATPTITSLVPASFPVLSYDSYVSDSGANDGNPLTVNGTGFAPNSYVTWNGSPIPTQYLDPTILYAEVPYINFAQTGMFPVGVVTPEAFPGTPLSSNTANFTVTGTPISVSAPASVVFGPIAVFNSATQKVQINVNGPNLGFGLIGNIQISLPAGPFTQTNSCEYLAYYCEIDVTFAPTVAGLQTATLTIQSTVGTTTIPLTGQGTTVPGDDFHNPVVISQSPFKTNLNVQAATESASDPEVPCFPANTTPLGGYRTVWFAYTPTQTAMVFATLAGTTIPAALSIWTGGPGVWENVRCTYSDLSTGQAAYVQATLNAATTYYFEVSYAAATTPMNLSFALNPPSQTGVELVVSDSVVYFGSQPIKQSASKTVTLTNTTSMPMVLTLALKSADYRETTTCSPSLQPGAQCTITITFQPLTSGFHRAYVEVTTDSGTRTGMTLGGVGFDASTSVLRPQRQSRP